LDLLAYATACRDSRILLILRLLCCCLLLFRCTRVSCGALQELLEGCKQLSKLVLPLQLQLEPLLQGHSHTLEVDEEQERQTLLLHLEH